MKPLSFLSLGMAQAEMLIGVDGDWIVMGSSAETIELTRATARGELPNVLANTELIASAILPDGPVNSVSFSDLSGRADAMADGIEAVGMFGGMAGMMIPDPQVAGMVGQVLEIVGRMGPVMRAMDFYDSSASVESFDGKFIRSHSVTNYVVD